MTNLEETRERQDLERRAVEIMQGVGIDRMRGGSAFLRKDEAIRIIDALQSAALFVCRASDRSYDHGFRAGAAYERDAAERRNEERLANLPYREPKNRSF